MDRSPLTTEYRAIRAAIQQHGGRVTNQQLADWLGRTFPVGLILSLAMGLVRDGFLTIVPTDDESPLVFSDTGLECMEEILPPAVPQGPVRDCH